MAFAGVWETWRDPEGEDVLSCTTVVSGASDWMTAYHDRMPVLLGPDQIEAWLTGGTGPDLLRPAPEAALREWVVDARVNRTGVGDDDPTLVDRVA